MDEPSLLNDPGTPEEPLPALYVGQHESNRTVPVTADLLQSAQDGNYDMLTAPVTTPHFQSRVLSILSDHAAELQKPSSPFDIPLPLISPLTPDDTNLAPSEINSALIAATSPWIDLGSPDPLIACISRQVFSLEVAYAAFCGIGNVLLPGPLLANGSDTTQFARAIKEALSLSPFIQVHILMPMSGDLEQDLDVRDVHLCELVREQYLVVDTERDGGKEEEESKDSEDEFANWEAWDVIRTMCNYNTRLSIALELPRQLPATNLQSRWYSEAVRILSIPRTSFLRNANGHPVLSKSHQEYITQFLQLRFNPWVLLSDVASIPQDTSSRATDNQPTPAEAAVQSGKTLQDPYAHLRYIRHLQQTQPNRAVIQRFGQGYQDYLQSPLQPLTDNLESITYEVFEKDPVKYRWYEDAIALALQDLRTQLGTGRDIVVAVVGAGRGPLMTRALQASESTGVSVKCWAVEKNPNAYVLLQRKNVTDPLWNKQVTVVKSDMRSWPGPIIDGKPNKVDILISELLGSFADNELSPECLDGIQHVLHPDHGVSIPQSYSAHFTPIAAPKLYADIAGRSSNDLNMSVADKWELPYVVMLHQYDDLSFQFSDSRLPNVQEAWSFSHPISSRILEQAHKRAGGTTDAGGWVGGDGSNEHNARSCKGSFICQEGGACHGLAGYFETVLYRSTIQAGKTIELSTNPITMERKSKDMISWFPIFFPIKTPIHVPRGGVIDVSMWRQTDDRKVWYEWVLEAFDGNKGKKARRLGMTDLHSTRKNGCLM
nr:protein arginine n-methyltransferase skb1 [Quercus suber]